MRDSYRLPDYTYTRDLDECLIAWELLGLKFRQLLGKNEEGNYIQVYGYDPGLSCFWPTGRFGGGQSFNIPSNIILALTRNFDKNTLYALHWRTKGPEFSPCTFRLDSEKSPGMKSPLLEGEILKVYKNLPKPLVDVHLALYGIENKCRYEKD